MKHDTNGRPVSLTKAELERLARASLFDQQYVFEFLTGQCRGLHDLPENDRKTLSICRKCGAVKKVNFEAPPTESDRLFILRDIARISPGVEVSDA